MSTVPVELWRRKGDGWVDATIHAELSPADLTLLERSWGGARLSLFGDLEKADVPRKCRPESLHWDWRKKIDELKLLESRGFGVLCEDEWQVAMMTRTASCVSRLDESKGKPLVYIDYLETAPWNWKVEALGRLGKFGGLGTLMFRLAVVQSIEEGFAGRVGLHALPQAEPFYAGIGMRRLAHDASKRLPYYELAEEQVNLIVEREGGAS